MDHVFAEVATMWRDRLRTLVEELEHELVVLLFSGQVGGSAELDAIVDRLDALAHDMGETAGRLQ
jgi:hypothetical protein